MITITINLYLLLKIYLYGSLFGLIFFLIEMDKEEVDNYIKQNKYGRIKFLLFPLYVCLLSWLNLIWIGENIKITIFNYLCDKRKYFLYSVLKCWSKFNFSRYSIILTYYMTKGYNIRVKNNYRKNKHLNKGDYDEEDCERYETLVEDRFTGRYEDRILLGRLKRLRGEK